MKKSNTYIKEGSAIAHDSPVWSYLAPWLILIGVTENSLALIVLSRKPFTRLPSRITLMTLAVVDCLVLSVGLTTYWINTMFETSPAEWSKHWCKILGFLTMTLSHMSSCLVALLSVERFIAVYRPNRRFRPSFDLIGTLIILIICIGVDLAQIPFINLKLNLNSTSSEENIEPGLFTERHTYICTYTYEEEALFIDVIDMFLLFGLPFTVILFCNFYIIHVIRIFTLSIRKLQRAIPLQLITGEAAVDEEHAVNLAATSQTGSRHFVAPDPIEENSKPSWNALCIDTAGKHVRQMKTTIMLLWITFVFLIFNLPFAVVHLLRSIPQVHVTREMMLAWLITYILVYIHNCLNFPIYVVTHSGFRSELKQMFCRSEPKSTITTTGLETRA
ncbi:hypothetical protein FBUS_02522 [Fasciolopsis buskii]|uniref:G-protein coupled receptors family 1 profile domain-containing protein n=1 Tax=Fasciolopsis buskii TaxID=27845 RepID=A0A8E0VK48_9TREM|nr:hypothetical protein FBUS_02522 [Fasciolopsis buski]